MLTALLLLAAQAGPPDTDRVPMPPTRVEASIPPPPVARRIDAARATIDRADRSDRLRRADARRARREVSQMRDLADRYGADGLSDAERQEIEARAAAMDSILKAPAGPRPR